MGTKIVQWLVLIGALVLAFLGFQKAREAADKASQTLREIKEQTAKLEAEKKLASDVKAAMEKTSEEVDQEIFSRGP